MLKEILNEKAIFALKGYAILEMRKNVKLVKMNMGMECQAWKKDFFNENKAYNNSYDEKVDNKYSSCNSRYKLMKNGT